MSLLILFNEPGGTGPPPPPPTTVEAIVIRDVYLSQSRIQGAYVSSPSFGSPISIASRIMGSYAATVVVTDVYQSTTTIKGN